MENGTVLAVVQHVCHWQESVGLKGHSRSVMSVRKVRRKLALTLSRVSDLGRLLDPAVLLDVSLQVVEMR